MDNHDITGYNPAEVTKTLAFASFFLCETKKGTNYLWFTKDL